MLNLFFLKNIAHQLPMSATENITDIPIDGILNYYLIELLMEFYIYVYCWSVKIHKENTKIGEV